MTLIDAAQAPTAVRFDAARDFLVKHALPLWSTLGAYPNGCFVEHLDLAGAPVDPGFTRVRVQARQIYVFSHAELTGLFNEPELCERSVDFFIKSAWLGKDRGFAKLITRDGDLVDGSSDLYDIAFALFALAWRYRAARDPRCLAIAHETLDFLDARMRHPAGGYFNDSARSQPRLQNPHMHLVEAMNAWIEASGDPRFFAQARALVALFETRFCDQSTGALGEYFNDDWTPLPGEQGEIVEPGHQFEWAWIIGHFGRLSGEPRPELLSKLIGFGRRHGLDEATGLTIDQVGRDGRVIASSRRLWPQTEAIKASLAAAEFLGERAPGRIARILDALFARFLDPGPAPGTWIDHYRPDWTLLVGKVPTTSLYHISLAFQELLRLRPLLEGCGD